MNNKMAINTYLSIIKYKKINKTSRKETESQIQRRFGWLPEVKGSGVQVKKVKRLKSTN